jgi:hypothetical protein
MARTYVVPGGYKALAQPQPVTENMEGIQEAKLNGGMNTRIDSSDLTNDVAVLAENCYIESDRTRRSSGSILLTPTKPNSDTPILVYQFIRFDGSAIFLRFSKNKIYRKGVSTWTEITCGTPFSVTSTTRIKVLPFNDRFFFSVGNDQIFEINFAANTYARLGNSSKYKYLAGFFNRVVGANLYDATTPNPILIGRSGDLNFSEWDPAVDLSAGSDPLLEGASDFADPITGLFAFAAQTLVLRERSLWIFTKQPVASQPFSYQAAFPTVGCDCPHSAASKRFGIAWYDSRTNQVYSYDVGQTPVEIGEAIRDDLKMLVLDKNYPQGSFDQISNTYKLCIPSPLSNLTYIYSFNFNTNGWTRRTINNCFGVYLVDNASYTNTILGLTGTITGLTSPTGTILGLTTTTNSPPATYYAMTDGNILVEDATQDTDNGSTITTNITSKIFKFPDEKSISISRLRFTYLVYKAGSFTIQYNNGNGWVTYKTVTMTVDDLAKRKRISCVKHISCKEFQWRLTSTAGDFAIMDYSLDFTQQDFAD